MKALISYLGILIVIIISVGASFVVYRHFNYQFAYKAMVEETVRDMVKEEALRKPNQN